MRFYLAVPFFVVFRKKRTKHPRSMSLNHFSAEHIDEPNMQGYLPGDIYVQQPIR